MTATATELSVIETCDQMLRLIAFVRAGKPRDPLRALEDVLLDLRSES